MISPTLNVPQARFLSMPHKFKAYIAGFGSGQNMGWSVAAYARGFGSIRV